MERPPTRRGSTAHSDLNPKTFSVDPEASSTTAMERPPTRNERLSTAASFKRPGSRMTTQSTAAESAGSSRLATAVRPPTGQDGRLTTAMPRPLSRAGGNAFPPRTATYTAAKERPTTQQGLGGLKTAYRGPQRQIQDKSYFQGLLRSKMAEISGEISKMVNDMDNYERESSALQLLEKQVKEMAVQITELQAESADWNLLQEKISTSSDLKNIEEEIKALQLQNERDSRDLELLLSDVKQKREQLSSIEKDLEMELNRTDTLFATLGPQERLNYKNLKSKSAELSQTVEQLSQELQALESRASAGEQEIQMWPAKLEAYRLRLSLMELEEKQKALQEAERGSEDPENEKNRLLANLRKDNAEVAAIEQQIKETQAAIERLHDDETNNDNRSVDESEKERTQKYRDLHKREQVMDEFMSNYETNRDEETKRIEELEGSIVNLLNKLSKQEAGIRNIPSLSEYNATKEDLILKESELKKSKATLEGLGHEHVRLQISIKKLDALETKITEELHTLKETLQSMAETSSKYSDLDELRSQVERKRAEILEEQQKLLEEKATLSSSVENLQFQCDELQAKLDSNEAHAQLFALEQKLQAIEESNQSVRNFLEKEEVSINVVELRRNVLNKVSEYQKALQDNYGR